MAIQRFTEGDVRRELPGRRQAALFWAKVIVLRSVRSVQNLITPVRRHLPNNAGTLDTEVVLAESRTSLWTAEDAVEQTLEMGKVHNLRMAAQAFDGVLVKAGQTLSFWRQLGPARAHRGYTRGRQLQEGCLVPAVGGGICQLSNALYDVALSAGCEIVERHPHTRVVPGSAAEAGRDATVAWNHIDLRFKPTQDVRFEVKLTGRDLVVRLLGSNSEGVAPTKTGRPSRTMLKVANSCATCGETECFRHAPTVALCRPGRRAWLVDSSWPEFADYMRQEAHNEDSLFLPVSNSRYDWPQDVVGCVHESKVLTWRRAVGSRRLSVQGPIRRAFELEMAARIADHMARRLEPDMTHLVVDVKFLATLWKSGHLGGRRFDVLLTRWPMELIHDALDVSAGRHPDRALLSDFRAIRSDLEAEEEALAAAEKVVTPHAWLALQFGERAVELPWAFPPATASQLGKSVAFPGPTASRKGAFEVREAAKSLGFEVVPLGSELEGEGFWKGVSTRRINPGEDWWDGVGVVVQPSVVEERPKRLLEAIARGIPVIATDACGIRASGFVRVIPVDDADALIEELKCFLDGSSYSLSPLTNGDE